MPRKVVAHVPPPSNNKICCFCSQGDDNELEYGKFHEYDGIVTHYYCLLLSSNMQQKGEDEEGILGFLPEDINKELKRGRRLICCYCKKSGATLGCCNTKCKKIFHFPCGLKSGSLHQFFGEFRSYCKNHRPKQKIDERVAEEVKRRDDMICYICYDEVNPHDMYGTLWAPCCKKNAWFHRGCVQQLAMSAGYFFKCPLCNNKTDFQKSMLDQGIFIPSQDASWELVPHAFEELLYRHNRCDADDCLCPKGREHTSSNAKWELTLCRTCGSQGIHMACGQLKWVKPVWECSECISILNKTTTTTTTSDSESSFALQIAAPRRQKPREYATSIDDDEASSSSSGSEISVGTETMEASTSDSTPSKIRDDDDDNNALGRKSPEEPIALRITRRSVIPIPKSPPARIQALPKETRKSEDLPPEPKRPRFADEVVERDRCVSVDSDDDIVVISGPSRNDIEGSKERRSGNAVEKLVEDSRTTAENPKIVEPSAKKDSQDSKNETSLASRETSSESRETLKKSETSRKVVEIDLSESECAITETPPISIPAESNRAISETRPISMPSEIPAASDQPEFSFMITNVTSLAPEAFESVPEQKEEPKPEPPCVVSPPRVFDDKAGGLTSQTPIILDDEPLPTPSINPATINNNNNPHFTPAEIHDQMKIIRFDNPTDARGNPTNAIVYGITIPGTNQTLPLIFTAPENDGAISSASPADLAKPSAIPAENVARDEGLKINLASGETIAGPTIIATVRNPTTTENRQIAKTRSGEILIAPKPAPPGSENSLSLSVPLKAIVNERFPGSRNARKSVDNGNNNKSKTSGRGSPLTPKPSAAAQPLPKGSFVRMPRASIFPKKESAKDSLPKSPPIASNGSSQLPSKPPAQLQQPKAPISSVPSQLEASTITKMYALLPPESYGQPKAFSPSVPYGVVPSNPPKNRPAILRPNGKTNGGFPNANTTWLHSNGSVLKISADPVTADGAAANLNPLTQQQQQQIFQLVRTDQNSASTDDCDGDAGSGPAGQPASVYNSTNTRPERDPADPRERDATPEVGESPASEHGGTYAAVCDSDSDDAADSSASSDWGDACDRAGLIYKSLNIRDLKFSVGGSNTVKMTVYDTYTVNIKVDSSNPCTNSKYSSPRRTSRTWLGRESRPSEIARNDFNDVARSSLNAVGSDSDDAASSRSESRENEAADLTNDSPGVHPESRGQEELKENLDPVSPAANSNHGATNVVDRNSKLRLHSCVNQSTRSASENEAHQAIVEKSEKKVAPRESQSSQNHPRVACNGRRDAAEETNAQHPPVETATRNSVPRGSSANDELFSADDSSHIHGFSKRKRISASPGEETENFSPGETENFSRANTNHLVNDARSAKHRWKSSDDVRRPRRIHVNSRGRIASRERLSCKVSIDLSRIRAVLAAKLDNSGRNAVDKLSRLYARRRDFFVAKSALRRSRSIDSLTFGGGGEDSAEELRRSWSASDLIGSSSRASVDNLVENRTRGCKRKRRSFEEHDCVR